MNKYKIIALCMIISLFLCSCSLSESSNNTNTNNVNKKNEAINDIKTKTKTTLTEEIVEISDAQKILYRKLTEYGDELYKKNEYNNYSKENDMLFISLNEMNEKYGYNIDMFVGEDGTVCDKNLSGIYFDIENKIIKPVDGEKTIPIVTTLVGCSKEERYQSEK